MNALKAWRLEVEELKEVAEEKWMDNSPKSGNQNSKHEKKLEKMNEFKQDDIRNDFCAAQPAGQETKKIPIPDTTHLRMKQKQKEPTTFVKVIDSDEEDIDVRFEELKFN